MVRRLKVLHVVLDLDQGGLERLVPEIARAMDHDRFESHVLCLDFAGRLAGGLEGSARLHHAGPLPFYSMLWPRSLARQIGRIGPDVVQTHSGVWYKASLAARLARVPRLVHTDHGRTRPDTLVDLWLDRLAARRTDVVVAVSEPLRGYLAARVVRNPRKVRLVRNGVDTEMFAPRADGDNVRRGNGLPVGRPLLGSVGRFDAVKGYDIMVEAFTRLRDSWNDGPFPSLVLVGDGPERAGLEERVERHGLGGDVRFLGWRQDVAALYSAFTLFTLASHSEGTSVSLLEAMSTGLCPVVTGVGGNADVLGDQLAHRLVEPGDPDALAAAWRTALADPARLREDGCAARARVAELFSLAAMVRRYEEIYTDG